MAAFIVTDSTLFCFSDSWYEASYKCNIYILQSFTSILCYVGIVGCLTLKNVQIPASYSSAILTLSVCVWVGITSMQNGSEGRKELPQKQPQGQVCFCQCVISHARGSAAFLGEAELKYVTV